MHKIPIWKLCWCTAVYIFMTKDYRMSLDSEPKMTILHLYIIRTAHKLNCKWFQRNVELYLMLLLIFTIIELLPHQTAVAGPLESWLFSNWYRPALMTFSWRVRTLCLAHQWRLSPWCDAPRHQRPRFQMLCQLPTCCRSQTDPADYKMVWIILRKVLEWKEVAGMQSVVTN